MKTFLGLCFLFSFATGFSAENPWETWPPGSRPGAVRISLISYVQGDFEKVISVKTNFHASHTDVVTAYQSTLLRGRIRTPDLIALLENSFHTNFPDSKLLCGGHSFYLAGPGTNLFDVSAVLSWEFDTSLFSSRYRTIISETETTNSVSMKGVSKGLAALKLIYNDTALQPADGKHTVFKLSGTASENYYLADPSFLFSGHGFGTVRGTNTILKGTIKGSGDSPDGTY
ncbi:MAG TPA: hypothetical protein VFW05_11580 [Verrucomicrobiae bacterium]|nr:hypothetical protein [Verrucomicrobiae bacterium]